MTQPIHDFDQLVADALAQDFSGWDFSWLRGRWHEEKPSWDYAQIVRRHMAMAHALLDMGTGGGEFLAGLEHHPSLTCATESYAPNAPVARDRLAPLGVPVVMPGDDKALPFAAGAFDLIINRHESLWGAEVQRILAHGGVFITQQVGARNCIQLNEFLQDQVVTAFPASTLQNMVNRLDEAGLCIVETQEEFPDSLFCDIGAVIFYLKVIAWQIPDFSVARYRERLLALHRHIQTHGSFQARAHRFLIQARKE